MDPNHQIQIPLDLNPTLPMTMSEVSIASSGNTIRKAHMESVVKEYIGIFQTCNVQDHLPRLKILLEHNPWLGLLVKQFCAKQEHEYAIEKQRYSEMRKKLDNARNLYRATLEVEQQKHLTQFLSLAWNQAMMMHFLVSVYLDTNCIWSIPAVIKVLENFNTFKVKYQKQWHKPGPVLTYHLHLDPVARKYIFALDIMGYD